MNAQVEMVDDDEVVAPAKTTQFLTLKLAEESYGLEILRVQEIRGWESVARVPNSPEYVCGVLNLRGSIVPVFDLRLRFGLPFREYRKDSVLIITKVKGEVDRLVGMVVDGVSDVLDAEISDIKHAPNFGDKIETHWILGLASAGDNMIMLLDVDKLFKKKSSSGDEIDDDGAEDE